MAYHGLSWDRIRRTSIPPSSVVSIDPVWIVKTIFLPLAVISTLLLVTTLVLGLMIEDAREASLSHQVDYHLWTSLGGMLFATMVHVLVMTYFIGTGRWFEETDRAYPHNSGCFDASRKLKYRTTLVLILGFGLLLAAGTLGAAADPASPVGFTGWLGIEPATLHLLVALAAVAINSWTHLVEYKALDENARLIEQMMSHVRRIRDERGLDS